MFVLLGSIASAVLFVITVYLLSLGYFFSAAAVWGVGSYIIFSLGVVAGYRFKEQELEESNYE